MTAPTRVFEKPRADPGPWLLLIFAISLILWVGIGLLAWRFVLNPVAWGEIVARLADSTEDAETRAMRLRAEALRDEALLLSSLWSRESARRPGWRPMLGEAAKDPVLGAARLAGWKVADPLRPEATQGVPSVLIQVIHDPEACLGFSTEETHPWPPANAELARTQMAEMRRERLMLDCQDFSSIGDSDYNEGKSPTDCLGRGSVFALRIDAEGHPGLDRRLTLPPGVRAACLYDDLDEDFAPSEDDEMTLVWRVVTK